MNTYIAQLLLLLFTIHIYSCCDPCSDTDCYNGAICNEGVCDCPEGYEGVNCEIDLSEVKRFLKRRIEETSYTTYEYTDDGLIKKISYFSDTHGLQKEFVYSFEKDTLYETSISKYPNIDTSIVKKYRIDENTIEEKRSNSSNQYSFTDNCLFSRVDLEGIGNYSTYEYIDSNCSYVATVYNNNQLSGKAIYTLDDGKSPLEISFEYFMAIDIGNIVRVDIYDLDNDPSGNTLLPNPYIDVFVTDKYGYPIKRTNTTLTGVSETIYEYYE